MEPRRVGAPGLQNGRKGNTPMSRKGGRRAPRPASGHGLQGGGQRPVHGAFGGLADGVVGIGAAFGAGRGASPQHVLLEGRFVDRGAVFLGVHEGPLFLGHGNRPQVVEALRPLGGIAGLDEGGDGDGGDEGDENDAHVAEGEAGDGQSFSLERTGRPLDLRQGDVAADRGRDGAQRPEAGDAEDAENEAGDGRAGRFGLLRRHGAASGSAGAASR